LDGDESPEAGEARGSSRRGNVGRGRGWRRHAWAEFSGSTRGVQVGRKLNRLAPSGMNRPSTEESGGMCWRRFVQGWFRLRYEIEDRREENETEIARGSV
jgi:hypothetical protein